MRYTPFDDTQTRTRSSVTPGVGYNTAGWDLYRQGVEITTNRFQFMGSQPKLWAGNTSGYSDVVTFGQNPGSIDSNVLGLESKFQDVPEFNPVAYIQLGVAYPLPIIFNDGPGEQLEATIEPLAIPFKKYSNEGPVYAHAIRGEYENGNMEGVSVRSANPVEQFVELYPTSNPRFFLDEGADYFGNVPKDPFVADVGTVPSPFDDSLSRSLGHRVRTTNPTIKQFAIGNTIPGEEDMLPYGKKSAPAGSTYYGPDAALYGTDSMAFGGWSLGT